MVEKIEKRFLFIPIQKTSKGYRGILSSDAVDRDNERISKHLLYKWSLSGHLPILADHDNSIDSYLGVWEGKNYNEVDGVAALEVAPKFFSDKANPKAGRVKAMLDEGMPVGLSIGAIPKSSRDIKIDGKTYTEWTEAELLEGSFTPVPSNRVTFANLAKKFNFDNHMKPTEEKKMTPEEIKKEGLKPDTKPTEPTPAPAADEPAKDGNDGDAPAEPDKPAEPAAPEDPKSDNGDGKPDGDGDDKGDAPADGAPAEEKKYSAKEVKALVQSEVAKAIKAVSVYTAKVEEPQSSPVGKDVSLGDIFAERAKQNLAGMGMA
ncbi:hypothetical protein LCGC14_1400540 [marine sediment metagenome]|uniref:Uncharacterized protein n=1 Tax=marine sediment metagenome TaxID=412755 RepID=A0A0F9JXI5_9ZZZZ